MSDRTMLQPIAPFQNYAVPTSDDNEAQRRFDVAQKKDPFPDIPPALLNSSDIYDYVRVTGMVCPFDEKRLKTASYEVEIGEECIYWDENGNREDVGLVGDKTFLLERNSIAFVTTKAKFRVPPYMALRFNLRITNVHKGLLLGTGPLVDPGYEGKLLIPIHNLTANKYKFRAGEGLIWVEFTKISPSVHWHPGWGGEAEIDYAKRVYKIFPVDKKNLAADFYLNEAAGDHENIRSSMPTVINALEESAKKAENAAETAKRHAGNLVKIGFASLVVGVVAVGVTIWVMHSHLVELSGELQSRIAALETRFELMPVDQAVAGASSGALEEGKELRQIDKELHEGDNKAPAVADGQDDSKGDNRIKPSSPQK
jgi:deoxycytidine triphosphate deaminase